MNLRELYEQKNKAITELAKKYGIKYDSKSTSLLGDIVLVCESQRSKTGVELQGKLSDPIKRRLKDLIPDNGTQENLLDDIAKLVSNGFNETTSKPRIVFGDEPNLEAAQSTVVAEVPIRSAEQLHSLQDNMNRLVTLLNNLNNRNMEATESEFTQIINRLKHFVQSNVVSMTVEQHENFLQEVSFLKNLVIEFIREHRKGEDRQIHDTFQVPLASLEYYLRILLETKKNPVNDVSNLIKFGE